MKVGLALAAALAVWTAWTLGPALQALAGLDGTLLWVDASVAPLVLAGLGGLWALAWGLTGLLALRLPFLEGARAAALGALVWVLGRAWPKVLGVPLPAPHDLPQRKLQIFLAGLFIASLALTVTLLLRSALKLSPWARLSPRQWALRLGALAWGVYLLSGLWTWRWHMTGDAPVYALLASAVAQDHSLDVQPGFARQEWKRFYDLDRTLEPQEPAQASGTRYIEHRPFSALLMAPLYRLGGIGGLLWMQSLLAALTAGLFYAVLRLRRFEPGQALFGFALFAFGAPWWTYSINLHIEVLGGALAWAWFCAWVGLLPAALEWFVPAALVWTALRYNPVAGLFSAATAWVQRQQRLRATLSLGAFALAVGAYAWLSKQHFESVSPVVQYGKQNHDLSQIIQPLSVIHHFFGVLLDQEFGMLPYSPVLVLAFAGAAVLLRRRDPWAWPLGLWIVPYGAMVCSTAWWYGSQNPDRYIIFLTPALTYLAVEGWRSFGFSAWTWALAVAGWAGALLLQVLPWFSYSKKDGAAWPLKILGRALHFDVSALFPSFLVMNTAAYVWGAALAVLLLGLIYKAYRAPQEA